MRLSEAIGLQRNDVDLDEGVLTVRESKFGKSRLVPLHRTTRGALLNYAERRDAHLGLRCGPHFFVAERGGRLLRQYVHRVFWRLSREIGFRRLGDHTGPRVHDFRHCFAIRTLLGWHRQGIDVGQQLPVLSTYLGRLPRIYLGVNAFQPTTLVKITYRLSEITPSSISLHLLSDRTVCTIL